MKIRFKKLHPKAILPQHAKFGDAGIDLTAVSIELVKDVEHAEYIKYKTGIAIEIPEGYVGLISARSSNCKKGLVLANSVGVIDSGYRGEIEFRYKINGLYDRSYLNESGEAIIRVANFPTPFKVPIYRVGDKVGQLLIVPYVFIESEFVEELSSTERGFDGFGSTGS